MHTMRLVALCSLLPSLCLAGSNFSRPSEEASLSAFIVGKWIYGYQNTRPTSTSHGVGTAIFRPDGTGTVEAVGTRIRMGDGKPTTCKINFRVDLTWSISGDVLTEVATRYEVRPISGQCSGYDPIVADPFLMKGYTWVSTVVERGTDYLNLKENRQPLHGAATMQLSLRRPLSAVNN